MDSKVRAKVAEVLPKLRHNNALVRERAWTDLHAALTPSLRSAFAFTSNEGVSTDEVVGEAWGKLFLRIERGLDLDAEALHAYLRRVCQNSFVDAKRRNRRLTDLPSEERYSIPSEADSLPSTTAPGVSDLSEAEVATLRSVLLARLSPTDLALYSLLSVGTSPEHAASQLGITRGTLDVRAYRLRQRLSRMAEAVLLYRALSDAGEE